MADFIHDRCICASYNFQLVMSLPAKSLGLQKGQNRGVSEVGGFQHWAQVTWLLLGLAVESPWSALGGPFLRNGLRKWSSGHVRPPFLAVKLFSCSVGVTIGQEL